MILDLVGTDLYRLERWSFLLNYLVKSHSHLGRIILVSIEQTGFGSGSSFIQYT